MTLTDIVSLDRTACAVDCQSKKRIFEVISGIAAEHLLEFEQAVILNSLLTREKLGSTGIGNGIAIPHGRIAGLLDIKAIVVTSDHAIAFDAIDDLPVDIFFAILVPEEQNEEHLKTLSSIARKLGDKLVVKAIRAATNKEEIIAALA